MAEHQADEDREPDGLVLELGTGFNDDETTVLVDGREVRPPRRLTTNYSVGLADVVPLSAPLSHPPVVLEVRVGSHAASLPLSADTTRRLRVDVESDGTLRVGPAPGGPIY